jgi:hypothetical protein
LAPSDPILLLAKIAVSAGFVLGVTAAVERLGPRLGALVSATPQLSVVSLIFFTLEQGAPFAAESVFWTIPGMCATVPVFLGSRRRRDARAHRARHHLAEPPFPAPLSQRTCPRYSPRPGGPLGEIAGSASRATIPASR